MSGAIYFKTLVLVNKGNCASNQRRNTVYATAKKRKIASAWFMACCIIYLCSVFLQLPAALFMRAGLGW